VSTTDRAVQPHRTPPPRTHPNKTGHHRQQTSTEATSTRSQKTKGQEAPEGAGGGRRETGAGRRPSHGQAAGSTTGNAADRRRAGGTGNRRGNGPRRNRGRGGDTRHNRAAAGEAKNARTSESEGAGEANTAQPTKPRRADRQPGGPRRGDPAQRPTAKPGAEKTQRRPQPRRAEASPGAAQAPQGRPARSPCVFFREGRKLGRPAAGLTSATEDGSRRGVLAIEGRAGGESGASFSGSFSSFKNMESEPDETPRRPQPTRRGHGACFSFFRKPRAAPSSAAAGYQTTTRHGPVIKLGLRAPSYPAATRRRIRFCRASSPAYERIVQARPARAVQQNIAPVT